MPTGALKDINKLGLTEGTYCRCGLQGCKNWRLVITLKAGRYFTCTEYRVCATQCMYMHILKFGIFLTVFGVIGIVVAFVIWNRSAHHQDKIVYAAQCHDDASISLHLTVDHAAFVGSFIAYSLDFNSGSAPRRLYSVAPPHLYDIKRTNDFEPLPVTAQMPMQVFELPDESRRDQWKRGNPPLMNIFLDPAKYSHSDFDVIEKCLAQNLSALNEALRALRSKLSIEDRHLYYTLRLGGIVYGDPPYNDPSYIATIRAIRGEAEYQQMKNLPTSGFLTLLPGQGAAGTLNGIQIVLFNVDGKYITVSEAGADPIPVTTSKNIAPYFINVHQRHKEGSITVEIGEYSSQ